MEIIFLESFYERSMGGQQLLNQHTYLRTNDLTHTDTPPLPPPPTNVSSPPSGPALAGVLMNVLIIIGYFYVLTGGGGRVVVRKTILSLFFGLYIYV